MAADCAPGAKFGVYDYLVIAGGEGEFKTLESIVVSVAAAGSPMFRWIGGIHACSREFSVVLVGTLKQ